MLCYDHYIMSAKWTHCASQVRGIKGVFLANQKIDGKVTTLITYNKGRDWEPLAPPTTDMNGKPISCKAVSTNPVFFDYFIDGTISLYKDKYTMCSM